MSIYLTFFNFQLIKLINSFTRPFIELYTVLQYITEQGKGTKTTLSYKDTNYELNILHTKFNQVAKTLQIAKAGQTSLNFLESSEALLNYYEAFSVFKSFENT
jgi:hypothetical protein